MRGAIAIWVCAWLLPIAATAPASAEPRARRTAQDHRGNRIEPFPQLGQSGTLGPLRNCTDDGRWCAELQWKPGSRSYTLQIRSRGRGLFPKTRRFAYPLPMELCCAGKDWGLGIWDEIIREPRLGVMIGVVLWKTTQAPTGFRSVQRRLLLLRVSTEDGGTPVPVLEAPLSGRIEQPVCSPAMISEERHGGESAWDRSAVCTDRFSLSALFTLLPSVGPVEPPDLIMVVTAETSPGPRSRAGGPVERAPVVRTDDDNVRDPACTYTRSFYFDETSGRYEPDAPIPACADYLVP